MGQDEGTFELKLVLAMILSENVATSLNQDGKEETTNTDWLKKEAPVGASQRSVISKYSLGEISQSRRLPILNALRTVRLR